MSLVDFEVEGSSVIIPREPKEMISVSDLGSGKRLVRINSSSLSVLQECKRKAKYLLHEGWKPEHESPATLFGRAAHKALEIFYSGNPSERILPKLEELELIGFGHVSESQGLIQRAIKGFCEVAKPLAPLPDSDKRSIQNGIWTLHCYFKSFIDDPYICLVDEHGHLTERAFTVRLFDSDDLQIDYFGTIDLIVRHQTTGEIMVCDHKTSSVVGNDFYNRLKPNAQYTGYLYGAMNALGIQTNSFLVNCLQVKPKPKTTRGQEPHFPRQITTRDENDFEEFRETVVASVREYLNSIEKNHWPLGSTTICANWGGCSYLQVCSAPLAMRENILKAKFIKETNTQGE